MKKQVSTLSLIALAAFSIWQYFTEHKKDTKPAPTTTQQQSQSAVKNTKDFGNGFYCTMIKEQAERWAKRYRTPMLNTYEVFIDDTLEILEFKEMTEEWLDFIFACRS